MRLTFLSALWVGMLKLNERSKWSLTPTYDVAAIIRQLKLKLERKRHLIPNYLLALTSSTQWSTHVYLCPMLNSKAQPHCEAFLSSQIQRTLWSLTSPRDTCPYGTRCSEGHRTNSDHLELFNVHWHCTVHGRSCIALPSKYVPPPRSGSNRRPWD